MPNAPLSNDYRTEGASGLTPRFLMALLSSLTTSIPSTPLALKRFVHVVRYPCRRTEGQRGTRRQHWTGGVTERVRLTSSSLVCWHGNENVNPTGSFLSLILCFSMKSPRHSATWSKSWKPGRDREALCELPLGACARVPVFDLLWSPCRG